MNRFEVIVLFLAVSIIIELKVIVVVLAVTTAIGASLIIDGWIRGTLDQSGPDWHPMEDAPRDGTHIIGRFGDREFLIRWDGVWDSADPSFDHSFLPDAWRHYHNQGVLAA